MCGIQRILMFLDGCLEEPDRASGILRFLINRILACTPGRKVWNLDKVCLEMTMRVFSNECDGQFFTTHFRPMITLSAKQ